MHTVEFSFSL
uniref:Uncharacterized protein n=1 Tax=Anguilla anguilla TaxID=7936 RepID=A0A0E9UHG6_ANGAN